MSRTYGDGFADGWYAALRQMKGLPQYGGAMAETMQDIIPIEKAPRSRRKRKQTGKAKILTDMARPIWNKYKKGSGKKTYFDIRSQVRRSNAYRKRVKNL